MSLPQQFENKFEILHKISEGGMGAVYKVRHQLLDQIQVIKVIRPQHEDDEDLRRRFQREAQTAMRMRHLNIAAMHDFSIGEGGTAYIVMEFIDGQTLRDLLEEQGALPLDLVMEIAGQGLDALDYLHRQGYIHRDVSPDNLMLTRDADGAAQVKLIDLGVAKQLGGGDLTATGMFVGKVRYSAPEQLSGKESDQRCDVYSFGVMLYQLLTGKVPVEGEDFSSLVAGHLFRPPLPFDVSDPEGRVPEGLRQVVLRALEKDPEKRIASAAELARLLAPFRTDVEATIATPLPASGDVRGEVRVVDTTAAGAGEGRRPTPAPSRPAEKRRGLRPLLAAAGTAATAAAVAAGWWMANEKPVLIAVSVPEWEMLYHDALAAIEAGELSGVPGRLRRARDINPDESAAPQWAAPEHAGPYLPHYHLGEAYYLQNNCVEALDSWRESERQGVVQTTPLHLELTALKAECEDLFSVGVERVERALARCQGLEKLLQDARDDPVFESIWKQSPELSRDVDEAIAGFHDLQQRFDAARDQGSSVGVLRLEQDTVDASEKLQDLLDRITERTR